MLSQPTTIHTVQDTSILPQDLFAVSHLSYVYCHLTFLKAAGFAIGIVGDAGVRANAQQEQIFVGMILILIFAEALGLYGMIIAIILSQ